MKYIAQLFSLVMVAAVSSTGCATDAKGNQCPLAEAYTSEDGDTFCADPLAPDDCLLLIDTILERTSDCSGIDKQSLEAEFESPFDCDSAIATSNDFDACVEGVEAAECDGNAPVFPDACQAAVLTN